MAEIDFLGALGAGSDIDSKSLVQSLVDAERAPKEASLNSKISKSESQISAYGQVLSSLGSLSSAFSALNDVSDFADYTVNVNGALALDGSPAYSVTATADVEPGINEVMVSSVATKDRWVSAAGYAATTTAINGGNGFTMDVTIDGTTTTVSVIDPSPQGVVDAMNDADLGIEASIVNTGAASDPYKILFSGELGADNAFTVTNTSSIGTTLSMTSQVSVASNSELVVNGVSIERTTNTITDAIDGVTLTLSAETAGISTIAVEQDKSGVETKLRALVDTYNEVKATFRNLTNPDSTEELGGTFSGDGSFRVITERVARLFSDPSSTSTDNLSYFSDIGISFDRYGDLEIDDDMLNSALSDNFSEIVSFLSADTENQSIYGEADRGIAGDAIQTLTSLMASDGTIMTRSNSLSNKIDDYQDDLDDLDRRMSQIYDRYLAQFTAMETAIDQFNSTKDYLKTALEGLPFNNRNSN